MLTDGSSERDCKSACFVRNLVSIRFHSNLVILLSSFPVLLLNLVLPNVTHIKNNIFRLNED